MLMRAASKRTPHISPPPEGPPPNKSCENRKRGCRVAVGSRIEAGKEKGIGVIG
jgi:hypothetical protein